jgi:uncharacterized protein with LGFP repeats
MGYPTSAEVWDGKGWWQNYEGGAIIGTNTTGFWESKGNIRKRWSELGYQSGSMGYPTSKVTTKSDGSEWQNFEHGLIIYSKDTGAWEVKGEIRSVWEKNGQQNGSLGYPVGPEIYNTTAKSWSQKYQGGQIEFSSIKGAATTKM